jgi:hypothetical protein
MKLIEPELIRSLLPALSDYVRETALRARTYLQGNVEWFSAVSRQSTAALRSRWRSAGGSLLGYTDVVEDGCYRATRITTSNAYAHVERVIHRNGHR